ncbi:hypothetical protein AHY58_000158 [Salmonella enterica subsp. enterica]|nr:hypothetical protein [Salmonella enterica]EBR9917579.1 hypothetical protein [Salmonella enterica subsp. enterica serovar Richmond]ECA9679755.1 hypothetical protein [Salmonella enterica subsp. enterica serovar Mikawasima]ECF2556455.1 hypothetical protein [Salmonella enterica subsp. enterica serovar Ahuza]ECH0881698.1 hypothetical protein [Salmonella enterica subsp. enterica serovar Potsdam]EDE8444018.1 hypothetical protein [Salmonella enterica subsp. enterica serovar Pomona]EDN8394521.1 hyp
MSENTQTALAGADADRAERINEVAAQLATGNLRLPDGLPFGMGADAVMQHDVTLREMTGSDIIDAQTAAERVVQTAQGPQLVSSPSLMGWETLRRQIGKVGCIDGPLSMAQLRQLSERDLEFLLIAVELKGSALVAQMAAAQGRLVAVSETD